MADGAPDAPDDFDISKFETKIDVDLPGAIPLADRDALLPFVVTVVSAHGLPAGHAGWACTVTVPGHAPDRTPTVGRADPWWNAPFVYRVPARESATIAVALLACDGAAEATAATLLLRLADFPVSREETYAMDADPPGPQVCLRVQVGDEAPVRRPSAAPELPLFGGDSALFLHAADESSEGGEPRAALPDAAARADSPYTHPVGCDRGV
jgi:hypothetical protein